MRMRSSLVVAMRVRIRSAVSRSEGAHMATPTEVVREFCAAFAGKDVATIERLLADDVVYHNVGMEPAVGKEASLASIQGFLDMSESLDQIGRASCRER